MTLTAQALPVPTGIAPEPLIAVAIVNWHSADWLRKCLLALGQASGLGRHSTVVVVDNASFDGTAALLAAEFPHVHHHQSPINLGFSKANNLAARLLGSVPTLLFLNPDTEVDPTALDELHRVLWSAPEIAAVGPRLLNSDRTLQTSCIQSFPTIVNQLLDSRWLRARFPRAGLWGMRPLFTPGLAPAPVNMVSGACLMIKRTAFEQVGGFSPDYFMYSEDMDLCHRLVQAGRQVLHVPRAIVVHHGGSSADRAPGEFSVIMSRESTWRFLRRVRGPFYAAMFRAALVPAAGLRILLLWLRGPIGPTRRSRGDGARRKWRAILRWALGLENTRVRSYATQ